MIATKQTRGQRAKLVRFKTHLATIFAKAKKEDSFLNESLVAEMGFEPHDLRVMSPASYQTAPLRDIWCRKPGSNRYEKKSHGILSPGRLPIPPFRQIRPWCFPVSYIIIALLVIKVKAFREKINICFRQTSQPPIRVKFYTIFGRFHRLNPHISCFAVKFIRR